MASMSVSGVVSGMDWEGMIDSILESAQKPALVQVNKRTNLTNKKSLFEEMKVTMNTIQSSLSPLKLPSTYKAKEIEIERIDKAGSYKGVLTATVNADAEVNVYDLEVKQLARAQTNRSKQITSANLKTTLGSIESSKMYINAGGQQVGIDVFNTDTLESLKSRINTTLKTLSTPLAVTASVVDSRLILKSDYTGLGKTSVTGTTAQNYNASGFTSLDTIITNKDSGASTNIVVDESNLDNLKIMSGTKTYSIHKDYEIINNQIRWKQYEDTGNVKLGDSVTATYKMGAGDVFSKTIKKGSDDSDDTNFDFNVIDNGTLSQRMKITGKKTTTSTTKTEKTTLGEDDELGTTTSTETTKDANGNDVVTKTTIKITEAEDDDGKTYYTVETTTDVTKVTDFVYGKDFTYKDGGITWLEQEATTNEPGSYTVSYEDKNTYSYTVSGDKADETITTTSTREPDSYSVKITTGSKGDYSVENTKGAITTPYDDITIDIDKIKQLYYDATEGQELPITTGRLGANVRTYIDPDNAYMDQLTIKAGDTTYQYGRDFIIIKESSSYQVVWGKYQNGGSLTNTPVVNAYRTSKGITDLPSTPPSEGTSYDFSYAYDYEEKFAGRVSKGDNDKTLETVFGQEISPLYYDKLEIRGYEYGTDYTVNDEGEIVWIETEDTKTLNTNDDATEFDVDEFNAAYKKATGSNIPTITLTGSDGVLRTYLDPADRSLFTLTSTDGDDTTAYEYGRDYVIRVKDDGDGYVLSWFAPDDMNSDGTIDANDANIAVSAYAQEKNISTLNFKAAPAGDVDYTFTFSKTLNDEYSKSVTASDSDKDLSLEALFGKDLELDEDAYSDIVIKDSDGKSYTYGTDFTVTDGEIVWLDVNETYAPNAPDKGTEYMITYESFKPLEATGTYDYEDFEVKLLNDNGKLSDTSGSYLSYEQILKDANSKLTTSSTQSEIDSALENYFTLTDEDGASYTYGTDYRLVMGDANTSGQHKAVLEWIGTNAPAYNDKFTLSYTGRGEGGGELFGIDKAVSRSNSDPVMTASDGAPDYDEFKAGTTTINQAGKTFYEGIDFEVGTNDAGNVLINWKTGTDYEWYYPAPGQNSQYTVNLTTDDGETKSFTATRGYRDSLDLRDYGFTSVSNNGQLTKLEYGGTTYDLTSTTRDDDGKTDSDLVKEKLGINLSNGTNGGVRVFDFDWITPTLTSRDGMPGYGDEISIDYEYNVNTFSLSDDGDGVIDMLGLNDDVTEAQNAVIILDGDEIERDLNDIGESYENELIKGMTLHLKGVGEVSMDVSHDAEKAIESIQEFVENYNSLMSWMNTRMTESQVDEDTAATIDSDDFRMRWGLLHGNSLLRNTKSQMRDLTAQNFTYSFTTRSSSEEIYGSMSMNGLRTDSTLRLRIASTYVDVPILTTDTLQDIVDKISDSSSDAMRNIFYGADGQLLDQPLIKAKVEGDKLVITSSSNDQITLSGSAAMNALKMNYTYKGVYQLGIATTSDDYGKSGELEFDTEKFMDALEDNPDEVQELMLKYAQSMDSWTKSMLNTSASGQTSGTLTRQISDLETQISSIDEYLEKYQERLDRMEESLRTKYAAAEQQISKLSQQASAISAILQQLSGNSNNSTSSNS